MSNTVSCTIITQHKNENKARELKNMVLDKFGLPFELLKSESHYKDENQWFFKLNLISDEKDSQSLIFQLLERATLLFERFLVSGPIIDDDTSEFSAFFIHFVKEKHGTRIHHCLEEFHIMVLNE